MLALADIAAPRSREVLEDALDVPDLRPEAIGGLLRLDGPRRGGALLSAVRALPLERGEHAYMYTERERGYRALTEALGIEHQLGWMLPGMVRSGARGALEEAGFWQPAGDLIPSELQAALFRARGTSELAQTCLEPATQHLAEQGLDIASGEGATQGSYRWRSAVALALLQALAGADAPNTPIELTMPLALLLLILEGQDDKAIVEASLERTETLLEVLRCQRQVIDPWIIDSLVERGPEVVPQLVSVLQDYKRSYWAALRAAEALEQIARAHPGSCDVALDALLEATVWDDGDYLHMATERALIAIGPAAVAPINRLLMSTDEIQSIVPLTALGEIPGEASLQVLLARVERQGGWGEFDAHTAEALGDLRAVPLLKRAWEEDEPHLAEALVVICELHGLEPELLPVLKQAIKEDEAAFQAATATLRGQSLLELLSGQRPLLRSTSKDRPNPKVKKRKRKLQKQARKKQRKKGKKRR